MGSWKILTRGMLPHGVGATGRSHGKKRRENVAIASDQTTIVGLTDRLELNGVDVSTWAGTANDRDSSSERQSACRRRILLLLQTARARRYCSSVILTSSPIWLVGGSNPRAPRDAAGCGDGRQP